MDFYLARETVYASHFVVISCDFSNESVLRMEVCMKKNRCILLMLAVLLVLTGSGVMGCGGNVINNGSDSRARDSVVSGASVLKGKDLPVRGEFCTDTNIYINVLKEKKQSDVEEGEYVYNDDIPGVVQTRLDGSFKKEIDMGEHFCSLIRVSGAWLYYITQEETSKDKNTSQIYRIPIKKGADGYDQVETTKRQKVLEDKFCSLYGEDFILVDEDYLVYIRDVENYDTEIVVYDLKKKEEIDFGEGKSDQCDDVEEVWRMEDQYAVLTEWDLLVMSPGMVEWKGVLNGGYTRDGEKTHNNRFFFYECFPTEEDECEYTPGPDHMEKDTIRIYDGREDQGFVTRNELQEAVENAVRSLDNFTKDDLGEWEIDELFCDDSKCYIQIEYTGTHDGIYHTGYLMLSKSVGDKQVRYEKDMTECMRFHEKEYEGTWWVKKKKEKKVVKENSIINPARCSNVINGKVHFCFHDKENERHWACYEPAAGQFSEYTRQDPILYECYYDGLYMEYLSALMSKDDVGFGYDDTEDILEVSILPEEDAYFEVLQ